MVKDGHNQMDFGLKALRQKANKQHKWMTDIDMDMDMDMGMDMYRS